MRQAQDLTQLAAPVVVLVVVRCARYSHVHAEVWTVLNPEPGTQLPPRMLLPRVPHRQRWSRSGLRRWPRWRPRGAPLASLLVPRPAGRVQVPGSGRARRFLQVVPVRGWGARGGPRRVWAFRHRSRRARNRCLVIVTAVGCR